MHPPGDTTELAIYSSTLIQNYKNSYHYIILEIRERSKILLTIDIELYRSHGPHVGNMR